MSPPIRRGPRFNHDEVTVETRAARLSERAPERRRVDVAAAERHDDALALEQRAQPLYLMTVRGTK